MTPSDGVPIAIGDPDDDYPMWQKRGVQRRALELDDTIPMTCDDMITKPMRKAAK